jgi:chromosome partitioning protein
MVWCNRRKQRRGRLKTIAFHLQKGGVGKTTLSVSTAWELANEGFRTVLIDCDPQGNSSSWLLEGRYEPEVELADVLLGDASVADAAVQIEERLWVIPTFGLTHTLTDYAKSGLAAEPFVIADLVDSLDYDFAVLDMGPGLGNIEQAALVATDEVVLTMTPEYFSLDGLETWAERVRKIERGMRVKISYEKLVVNGLNESVGQMRDVHNDAKKAAREVYTIGTDPAFRKSQAEHLPVQRLSRKEAMKPENREELIRLTRRLSNGAR